MRTILRGKSVSWSHPLQRAYSQIGITRRNPASFNKAGPSRQISACCEEDHGLSIDKRAPTLKSLMRQFLTRKTVCKPAVRNVEVNKFQKRCPMRKTSGARPKPCRQIVDRTSVSPLQPAHRTGSHGGCDGPRFLFARRSTSADESF